MSPLTTGFPFKLWIDRLLPLVLRIELTIDDFQNVPSGSSVEEGKTKEARVGKESRIHRPICTLRSVCWGTTQSTGWVACIKRRVCQ